MKVFIGYYTITGNTQKIAEAIYEEIQVEKKLEKLNLTKDIPEGYDIYFLGFPMLHMGPNELEIKFLNKIKKQKKLALFITHGGPEWSPKMIEWLNIFKKSLKNSENQLVGIFDCQGKVSKAGFNYTRKVGDSEFMKWDESYMVHDKPNLASVNKAKEFAREVLKRFEIVKK
jgi:flavodoxin